ncbi:MAG: NAD(P)-dependent oxidoreductase [Pseudomonadota bacterium]
MTQDPFRVAYDLFPSSEIPFLERAKKIARRTRPYDGLKILQNIPVTMEALHKTHVLMLGGADLTLTCPSFMDPKPEALAVLDAAGVAVVDVPNIPSDVDIALDCAGELLGRVTPRLGTVELTGTGTNRYQAAGDLSYPVISVDQSQVKVLEALFGTGDAFQRAFSTLTGETLKGKDVLLFGYGKVGQGIAYALHPSGCRITVVDVSADALCGAKRHGHAAIPAHDTDAVEIAASKAFVVVTATGRPGIISERYATEPFRGARYRANMGGEDEFGPAFDNTEIMVDKRPINFAIAHPTRIRFLDPIFHAHNLGVDLLRSFAPGPGLHAFPEFLAAQILTEWEDIFSVDVEAVLKR